VIYVNKESFSRCFKKSYRNYSNYSSLWREIRLFAQGIQLPTQEGEDRLRYLGECKASGILPFSKLTLIGCAYPRVSIGGNNSLLAILNGGRMHEVSCDDGGRQYSPENFDIFKKRIFSTLLNEGYSLTYKISKIIPCIVIKNTFQLLLDC